MSPKVIQISTVFDLEVTRMHLAIFARDPLFHYPQADSETVSQHVNLAHGIIDFSREFSGTTPGYVDADGQRMLFELLEKPDLWLVAALDVNDNDLALEDLLLADLRLAYRNFRLHHGPINPQTPLAPAMSQWWAAWAKLWDTSLHGSGALKLCGEYTRMAAGSIRPATQEAARSVAAKEDPDQFVDMLVTCHYSESAMRDGCVWRGNGTLGVESVNDIVRWLSDCVEYDNHTSFTESSGFVYHLDKHSPSKESRVASISSTVPLADVNDNDSESSDESPKDGPALSQMPSLLDLKPQEPQISQETVQGHISPASSIVIDKKRQGFLSDLSEGITSMGSVMGRSISTATATATTATVDSMNQLIGYVDPVTALFRPRTTSQAAAVVREPAHDPSESRFVIGPRDLGDYDSEVQTSTVITKKDLFLKLTCTDTYQQVSVVVFQQAPFLVTLVYAHQSPLLDDIDHYARLRRRLASIIDPFYTDLVAHEAPPRFHYLVLDPQSQTVQTSLPTIPDASTDQDLKQLSASSAEKLVTERLELVHVHQHIAAAFLVPLLRSSTRSHTKERYVRTSRNWWIYWANVDKSSPDGRQVILARKLPKSGQAPPLKMHNKSKNHSQIVGSLTKDVRGWLDEYKQHGTV